MKQLKVRNRAKTVLAGVFVLALGMTALSACTSKGDGSSSQASNTPSGTSTSATPKPSVKEDPFKLSLLMLQYQADTPKSDNIFLQAIEKATNTKLDITWVPQAQIDEKTNLLLASGDVPKLMYIQNFKSPSIQNAIKAGAFWEIGPYLKDYPTLSKANPSILQNTSVDGKIYSVYKYASVAQVGVTYRKDWLDALGLQPPKSVDDFYNTLKAFKEKDPDKNGKDDTYGMVYWQESFLSMFRIVSLWHGAPNIWGEDTNGNLIPDFMTDGYMKGMKLMKKLYDEKLINQDFAVMTNAKANDIFLGGGAGSVFATTASMTNWDNNEKIKAQKGKLDLFSELEGGHGPRARAGTGYLGMYMIPKSSVKSEDELKKVLAFLDKLNSKEVQDLLVNGIEGRHYKVENGQAVRLENLPPEQEFTKERFDFPNLYLRTVVNETPKKLNEIQQRAEDIKSANEKVAVYNLVEPFNSDSYSKLGQQLDTMRYDMLVKFVMGQLDEAGYKAEVDKWLKAGGKTVIDEFNAQYQKLKKK
jgi:putative aldouronate transport system substrate-binding protein